MIKTVFFGTPEFASKFLESLHADEDISVDAVVCQPDKPVGRKKIITAPATKNFAAENDIDVLQPESLRSAEIADQLRKINADLFVIIAYGKIIPQEILDIPKQGCVNVHPSLLPKYRGPSPIQSAILNQESETAVTVMLIDEKMDHGPILAQKSISINANETSTSLRGKVVEIGKPLLIETVKKYADGKIEPQEQNHDEATFCKMLEKADAKIDWNTSAEDIYAKHRAFFEWPGVYTIAERGDNESKLKLHDISISMQTIEPGRIAFEENRMFIGTSTKAIEIYKIQPEGGQTMPADAFMRGRPELNGIILG